jgi:hypothetical protein
MTPVTRFERLSQSDLRLAEGEEDLRDRTVIDMHGEEIGTVRGLYIDIDERTVRFLLVRGGGLLGIGDREYLVPVEGIDSFDSERVRLRHDRAHVENGPAYDPDLEPDPPYWVGLYGYYGYPSLLASTPADDPIFPSQAPPYARPRTDDEPGSRQA